MRCLRVLAALLAFTVPGGSAWGQDCALRERLVTEALKSENGRALFKIELSAIHNSTRSDDVETFLSILDAMGAWDDPAVHADLIAILRPDHHGPLSMPVVLEDTAALWRAGLLSPDQARRMLSNYAHRLRPSDLPLIEGFDGLLRSSQLQSKIVARLNTKFPTLSMTHAWSFISYLVQAGDETAARQLLYQIENVWPENMARLTIEQAAVNYNAGMGKPALWGPSGLRNVILEELNTPLEYQRHVSDLLNVTYPPSKRQVEAALAIMKISFEDRVLLPPYFHDIGETALAVLTEAPTQDGLLDVLRSVVRTGQIPGARPGSHAGLGAVALVDAELRLNHAGQKVGFRWTNRYGNSNLADTIHGLALFPSWTSEDLPSFLEQLKRRVESDSSGRLARELFSNDGEPFSSSELMVLLRLLRESGARGAWPLVQKVQSLAVLEKGVIRDEAGLTLASITRPKTNR